MFRYCEKLLYLGSLKGSQLCQASNLPLDFFKEFLVLATKGKAFCDTLVRRQRWSLAWNRTCSHFKWSSIKWALDWQNWGLLYDSGYGIQTTSRSCLDKQDILVCGENTRQLPCSFRLDPERSDCRSTQLWTWAKNQWVSKAERQYRKHDLQDQSDDWISRTRCEHCS